MSARPLQAQDKLAFLLSLVPYLIDHEQVSVAEAAKHFGVRDDEMRRAVELIAVSGLPGDSDAYLHNDLFDINWDEFEENDLIVLTHSVAIDESPRFSARETAALLAGLQYLSALPENADRAALASLMNKLARGPPPRRAPWWSPAPASTRTSRSCGMPSSRSIRSSSRTGMRRATPRPAPSIRCGSTRTTRTGTSGAGTMPARLSAPSGSTG
ncbi:hypothetical protein GCM10025866_31880 [Naasia aerilata]|uniref:PafC HTH domain-containing protein n=1 Tax=Naasia aerilata TaxID=1162966 RepID=A0ABM8GG23_9MICO|nr:hypothetical protein GCM10025866_31880 [Naasia aerilata]